MNFISSKDIKEFGSYPDRKNSFDDELELDVAVKFISKYLNSGEIIKKKPFGKYGVDIAVFDELNKLKYAVDVERWSKWGEDWPSNYKHLSFLARKDKFLNHPQFVMLFFNYDLTKLVRIHKNDILKVPPTKQYIQGRYDLIRKIPFKFGKLYGKKLGNLEKSIFECEECNFK